MNPTKMLAVVSLLAAIGCGALANDRRTNRFTTREEPPPPPTVTAPCRVYVVPVAEAGARRVGSIRVPAELAADSRLDQQSRDYACGLSASQAVKEEEVVEKNGRRIWKMGIYRL